MLHGREHPRGCYVLVAKILEISEGFFFKIQLNVSLTEFVTYIYLSVLGMLEGSGWEDVQLTPAAGC